MADATQTLRGTPSPAPPALTHVLRTYWWLIALPVIVLCAVAIALGASRSPEYTTQAELNVGRTDLATQALPGFVDGAISLADSYSRIIESQRITDAVARRLRVPPSTIESRLSAVPVPERTVFRIKATGDSAAQAEQIARAATTEIQRYVSNLSVSQSETARLLRSYRLASTNAQRLSGRVDQLEQDEAPNDQIRAAKVDEATARLRVTALAAQYQDARPTSSGSSVQLLDDADTATSDRSAVTQRYLAVALVLGLLIGVAFAITVAGRSWRRSLRG